MERLHYGVMLFKFARYGLMIVALLPFALNGCSTEEPLDPYVLRAELKGSYFFPPKGFVRGREDENEGALEGDEIQLQRDLDVEDTVGYGASLELRPSVNDEVRGEFLQAAEFEGGETLTRKRRFDGRTYLSGEHVGSSIDWERIRVSYAHRMLALRSFDSFAVDVLARAGGEQGTLATSLEGDVNPKESRELRSGAPFGGVELRVLLSEGFMLWGGANGGYWNHDGARLALVDLGAGARMTIVGPLDAGLSYDFSYRDATSRFHDGELTATRLLVHGASLSFGLKF